MENSPNFKVVIDGLKKHVYLDGKELHGVSNVKISSIDADSVPTLTLTFCAFNLDIKNEELLK